MMSETNDNSPQCEVTGRSSRSAEPTDDGDLGKVIRIQSLLLQFSHPQVRSALLQGKFNVPADETTLLQQIDQLRWILLPAYDVSSSRCCEIAAGHFTELLARSPRRFVIGEGDVMLKPTVHGTIFLNCSQTQIFGEVCQWLTAVFIFRVRTVMTHLCWNLMR